MVRSYEALRVEAIQAGAGNRGPGKNTRDAGNRGRGYVLLMRRGMTSWAQAWGRTATARFVQPAACEEAPRWDPPRDAHEHIVMLLAHMALGNREGGVKRCSANIHER